MECGVEHSWVTCEQGTKHCVKELDNSVSVECMSNVWAQPCKENEFLCYTGGECIHKNNVCNFENNCADGSDEIKEFCDTYEKYPHDKKKGSCLVKLPQGITAVQKNNAVLENHSYCKDGTYVRYYCKGWLSTQNLCNNGKWDLVAPTCKKNYCSLSLIELAPPSNSRKIQFQCTNNNIPSKHCSTIEQGGNVILTCAPGSKDKNEESIVLECKADGWDWGKNLKKRILHCENTCRAFDLNAFSEAGLNNLFTLDSLIFIGNSYQLVNSDNESSVFNPFPFNIYDKEYSAIHPELIYFHRKLPFYFLLTNVYDLFMDTYLPICFIRPEENLEPKNLFVKYHQGDFKIANCTENDDELNSNVCVIDDNISSNDIRLRFRKETQHKDYFVEGCRANIHIYSEKNNKYYLFAIFKHCESKNIMVLTKISAHDYQLINAFHENCYFDHELQRIFENITQLNKLGFQKLYKVGPKIMTPNAVTPRKTVNRRRKPVL